MGDAVYDPGDAATVPTEPSSAAKVLGILSIIFGAIVALANLAEMIQGAAPRWQFGPPGMEHQREVDVTAINEAVARVAPYVQVGAGLMLIMSIALVIIGFGVYKHREKARRAALVWAVLAFAVLGMRGWLFDRKIWPTLSPAIEQATKQAIQEAEKKEGKKVPFDVGAFVSTIGRFSELGKLAAMGVFPLLLLILLSRPGVKQRMLS